MPNRDDERNNYITREDEYKPAGKKRKISFLIIALASLIFAITYFFQIILSFMDVLGVIGLASRIICVSAGLILFLIFILLFIFKKENIKNQVIFRDEDARLRDLTNNDNIEVVDGFADLTDIHGSSPNGQYSQESAVNQKVEDVDETTFELTTTSIAEKLFYCFHNAGLHGDSSLLLGAIASSNLIFVKDDKNAEAILASLATTFGGDGFLVDVAKLKDESDLINQDNFLDAIEEASNAINELRFFGFKNISYAKVKDLIPDFLEALYDKNNSSKVILERKGQEEMFMITPNIFFIFFVSPTDRIFNLDAQILKYSTNINLQIKNAQFDPIDIENEKISNIDFRHSIANAVNDFYISDNRWKKIDEFVEFLNSKKKYSLDTDVVNNIEAFSGVLLSLNNRKDETFDKLCSSLFLPSILKTYGKKYIKGDTGIYNFITENFFSDYSLPRTDSLLRESAYIEEEVESSKKEIKQSRVEESEKKSSFKEEVVKEKVVVEENKHVNKGKEEIEEEKQTEVPKVPHMNMPKSKPKFISEAEQNSKKEDDGNVNSKEGGK